MEKFDELIKSPIPVLIDFYTEWCNPCRTMKPILEEVKKQLGDKVRIIKIDADKHADLASAHQIQAIPTLILYKNGKKLWRHSGVIRVEALKETIEQYL